MDFFISDLDGCITKDWWRFKEVDHSLPDKFEKYALYNSQCHMDEPANIDRLVREAQKKSCLIVSARPESVRQETLAWLSRHVPFTISRSNVLLRQNDDLSTSPDLKRRMVLEWMRRNPNARIRVAFDDRDDVLVMYQELGINAIKLVSEHYARVENE